MVEGGEEEANTSSSVPQVNPPVDMEGSAEELEAQHIYLVLQKDRRVSRSFRAEWYMSHLNSVVRVPRISSIVSSISLQVRLFFGDISFDCVQII